MTKRRKHAANAPAIRADAPEQSLDGLVAGIYSSGDFPRYNPDELLARKGTRIYDQIAADSQVKACLKFKRDAIIARGNYFKLTAEGSNLDPDEVQRRIAVCNEIVRQIRGTFSDVLTGVLGNGWKFGNSRAEINHTTIEVDGHPFIGLRNVKLRNPLTFAVKTDPHGNLTGLEQRDGFKTVECDPDKFLSFVVNPDVCPHYGQSELYAIYREWHTKDLAMKVRAVYMTRLAGGYHTIAPPDNVTLRPGTADHTAAQELVNAIGTASGIVKPSSKWTIESHLQNGTGGDFFNKVIEQCDMMIARGLLVPAMMGVSPQGNTGGYSQAETQLDAFFGTLIADADRLADCLNEQVFRPLGLVNFGDQYSPEFAWQPMSRSRAVELIKQFAELVDKRVLTNTPEDEAYIRKALDLPNVQAAVGEDDAAPPLDAAQLQYIQQLCGAVESGSVPCEVGRELLRLGFPTLDEETIATLLPEPLPPEQPPAADPMPPAGDPATDTPPGEEGTGAGGPDGPPTDGNADPGHPDETIAGRQAVRIAAAAFAKATARVSFAVIERDSERIVSDAIHDVSAVCGTVLAEMVASARSGGELTEDVMGNMAALRVEPKTKTKLNNTLGGVLRAGEKLGRVQAAREIDKAKGAAFSVAAGRLDMIAGDYFKAASFRMTGNVLAEMQKLVEAEIINGARYGKSWDEVTHAIYMAAASKGLLGIDEAQQALGDAMGVDNPDARLRTIVRTSTFEAINTARDTYFTDPALGDFVKAFEYSAILDDRTTPICRHLDDENAGDHSVQWYADNPGYKPPNHFNCRSILVPVTANDLSEYTEGPQPSIEPMEGFA